MLQIESKAQDYKWLSQFLGSFICTLTAKSEMVRGCCNRQILEDVIILWVGLGCLYFLHMVTCPGKLLCWTGWKMRISGNLFLDLIKPTLRWILIGKWVLLN